MQLRRIGFVIGVVVSCVACASQRAGTNAARPTAASASEAETGGAATAADARDPAVERATAALGDLPRPWTVPRLLTLHAIERDLERRRHLTVLLASTRDPRAAVRLGEVLGGGGGGGDDAPAPDVRREAAQGLVRYFVEPPVLEGGSEQVMDAATAWWRTHEAELRRRAAALDATSPTSARSSSTVSTSTSPPKPPPLPPPQSTITKLSVARSIRVHFLGDDEPHRDCRAHTWVARQVPAQADPIATALRASLGGPTRIEEQRGLRSPYVRSVSDPRTPPLSLSQVKITVSAGTATVDFTAAAAPYLNQAICARVGVTSAIESTLLQFREIQRVVFAVDGIVVEEWDA